MANVKISQLPNTGTPSAAGLLPIVQDGTTYHASAADIVSLVSSTDVVDALGFTPVNPTALTSLVPNSRTLTINGTTQDLSANRTFTIPSGAATIDLTSSNGNNVGDLLYVNASGSAASIASGVTTPSFVDYQGQSTNTGSIGYNYNELVLVNPHDKSQVVNFYVDGSNQFSAILTVVNNTEIYNTTSFGMVTPLVITSGIQYFSAKWDPFNKDRILVMYLSGSALYGQYVSIVLPYSNSTSPSAIALSGSAFMIISNVGNSKVIDFEFSAKYANVLVVGYTDVSTSYPTVVSCSIVMNSGSYSCFTSAPLAINTNAFYGSYHSSYFKLARLEGEDVFGYQTKYYDGIGDVIQFTIFTLPAVTNPQSLSPLSVGTSTTVMGNSYNCDTLDAHFISNTQFLCTGYGNGPNMAYAVGEFAGTTINVGSISVSTVIGDFGYSISVVQMPVNKNYFMTYYISAASSIVKGQLNVFTGTSNFTLGTIDILVYGTAPDFVTISNFTSSSADFVKSVDGVAYWYMFVFNSSIGQWYTKVVPITYISKLFTNKTLIGIAQTAASMGGVVEVLPFGSVDTNQAGLSAATAYYLQDDGTITTNVTPTLLGTGLSATTIKTASYPQL